MPDEQRLQHREVAVDRCPRQLQVVGERVDVELPTRRGGQESEEAGELPGMSHPGDVQHLPLRERSRIRIEPAGSRRRAGSDDGRVATRTDHPPVRVAGDHRPGPCDVPRRPRVREESIDEPLIGVLDLAVRQRPQVDDLHPASQ